MCTNGTLWPNGLIPLEAKSCYFTLIFLFNFSFSISARTQFIGSAVIVISSVFILIIGLVAGLATPALENGGSPDPQPGPNVTETFIKSRAQINLEFLNEMAARW